MNRKRTAPFFAALFAGSLLAGAAIDNSALMPPYKPDAEVVMEKDAEGGETPDWIKSLIIVELRIHSASTDGTVKGLLPALDHLAEMGVNGVWLTPPINGGNGYGNFGIHTLSPLLTGEKNPVKQWQVLRNFVDEAHKRNIRVFFDVVNWGATKHEGGSRLLKEKPEWFGEYFAPYAGWFFNWENRELNEWFSSRLVEWFLMTGVDGFRCDCAPKYSGFGPFETAKKRMRSFGRKVVFMAEWTSSGKNVFDLDQLTFCFTDTKGKRRTHWVGDVYLKKNIVDMVRSGEELRAWDDMEREPGTKRFYTYMLSCHDSDHYIVKGSPITIGYQAIFAPFIPLWYVGEEWDNAPRFFVDYFYRRDKHPVPKKWRLYGNVIDWAQKEENRDFFELVKKMIRIRRQHPEIFEYFPGSHRDSNICKVATDRPGLLQAYARFRNGRAVLIVPNNTEKAERFRITIPFREAELAAGKTYRVTDLLEDRTAAEVRNGSFEAEIAAGQLGVFLVAPAE